MHVKRLSILHNRVTRIVAALGAAAKLDAAAGNHIDDFALAFILAHPPGLGRLSGEVRLWARPKRSDVVGFSRLRFSIAFQKPTIPNSKDTTHSLSRHVALVGHVLSIIHPHRYLLYHHIPGTCLVIAETNRPA